MQDAKNGGPIKGDFSWDNIPAVEQHFYNAKPLQLKKNRYKTDNILFQVIDLARKQPQRPEINHL